VSLGKKAGKGSHGSLTKAGKVKWQGFKPRKIDQNPRKKHDCPRVSNKKKYRKRIILKRNCGQN